VARIKEATNLISAMPYKSISKGDLPQLRHSEDGLVQAASPVDSSLSAVYLRLAFFPFFSSTPQSVEPFRQIKYPKPGSAE